MRLYHLTCVSLIALLAACTAAPQEIDESSANVPTTHELNLLRLANATRAAGDYTAAEKLYLDAIGKADGTIEAHVALADLYDGMHKYDKAAATLEQAAGIKPENMEVRLLLASTLVSAGRAHDALVHADKAAQIDPENPRALNIKGVALDAQGRYAEAQKQYMKAIRIDPQMVYLKNNLALSCIMSDNYDQAIKILLPLADSAQSTPTVRQNLALAYGLKGDGMKALELGLKDLPEEQAQQNVEFYKQFASHREVSSTSSVNTTTTPVAANDIGVPESLPVAANDAETAPILVPAKDVSNAAAPVANVTASVEPARASAPVEAASVAAQAMPVSSPVAPAATDVAIAPAAPAEPVGQSSPAAIAAKHAAYVKPVILSKAQPVTEEHDDDLSDIAPAAGKTEAQAPVLKTGSRANKPLTHSKPVSPSARNRH